MVLLIDLLLNNELLIFTDRSRTIIIYLNKEHKHSTNCLRDASHRYDYLERN